MTEAVVAGKPGVRGATEPERRAHRPTGMDGPRPRVHLVGGLALLLMCVGCGGPSSTRGTSGTGGTSTASCVGPYLDDQPPSGPFRGPVPTVAPGDSITIYGHWYTSTCRDTGGQARLAPLPPVHLTLTLPGGARVELGEFMAQGQDMGLLHHGARAGRYSCGLRDGS